MSPDPDYVTRVVQHRAPEVADSICTYDFVEHVLEAIDAMAERLRALEAEKAAWRPWRAPWEAR
jgi:hypothetical protein